MAFNFTDDEVLELSENPDALAAKIGEVRYNYIRGNDPDMIPKLSNVSYWSRKYDRDFDEIMNNYEAFSKGIGLSGIPKDDNQNIIGEINRSREIKETVDPVSFSEGLGGAVQVGKGQLAQNMTMIGISDPSTQTLVSDKVRQIKEQEDLAQIVGETDPEQAEAIRFGIQRDQRLLAGLVSSNARSIKDFVSAQEDIDSAVLSKGFREFQEEGKIPTGVKGFSQFLSGLLVSQTVAQAPTIAKTLVSGPAAPAVVFQETLNTERANEMIAHLKENKVDFNDEESLRAALNNESLMKDAQSRGMRKAFPVALFAMLSAGYVPGGKSLMGKLVKEGSSQAALDALGESFGQLSATGEVNLQDVFVEVLAGTTQSAAEAGAKLTSSLVSKNFKEVASTSDGTPNSPEDWRLLSESVDEIEILQKLETQYEKDLIQSALEGDKGAQDQATNLIQQIEDGDIVITPREPTEVDTAVDEIKLLTEGIRSAETEIETNLDVQEEAETVVRPGDPRDEVKIPKERLPRKRLTKDEKIEQLKEKLVQQKNDLALKAKETASKIRKRAEEKLKAVRAELKAKNIDQKQALRDQAASVKEAIGQVESMVNQMPADVQARFKGFKKLANAKTLTALQKGLNESLNKLQNLYIEETQKVLVKNINKTVKQTTKDLKAAKEGKKPFKHGPEVIRQMELAGYNGGEARKVAQQRYEDLIDRVQSAPDDSPYEMTEGDREIEREAMIPNVAEGQTVDNELLARYLADLKSVKSNGLSAHNAKKAKRAKRIALTGEKIKNSIDRNSKRKKNKDLSERDAARDRGIKDMIREGNQELLDTRSISAALTGEKRNRLDTLIFEKVADGVSDSILAHQEYTAFIDQKAKDLGLDLTKSGNIPIRQVGKKQMSMYEAMFVYGHSQNDLGMEHLKNTDFGGIKLRGEIQGIIDLLPQNHKDFVDSLIDYNDNVMYPRLNELYMEMYGVPMPKEDRYLPLMNLSSKTAFDHALKENPTFMRIHTSFLRSRSKSKLGFETLELIGSLQKHNASAEHAIALHSTLTDANLMFKDSGLQETMNEAFPGSLAYVREYINTVAKGEMIKPKGQWDRGLRIMRNNTRTYWLAANPGAWAKTQAPMISALQSIDKGAAASAAMRHFGKSNWRLASSKSKFMKTRPHSNRIEMMELASRNFEPGATKTFKNLKAQAKRLHAWSQKYAYWMYTPLDLAATSTAWVGKYTEAMNKHGVEADAILEADDVVKRFFPTGRIDELPPLFREQGMKKELFIFTSDMNRHYNLGYTATQLKQRRVQEAIMFAFYGVLMSSAYLAFTDAGMDAFKETLGLKDEEDERGKQFLKDSARYMASQVVGGIPVLGKVVESTVAAASGDGQLSRMMAKQTPISMYSAGQAMTQNFGTAAFSLFGIPGGNLFAPHIDDYLKDRDGEDDFLSDF